MTLYVCIAIGQILNKHTSRNGERCGKINMVNIQKSNINNLNFIKMGEVKKTKKGTESNEVKMISVEQANAQMQNVLQQYNAKMQQMNIQMQQMDAMLRDRTLEHLFNVVKYSSMFNSDFVLKCTDTIEQYLAQVAFTEPEKTEETVDSEPQNPVTE